MNIASTALLAAVTLTQGTMCLQFAVEPKMVKTKKGTRP